MREGGWLCERVAAGVLRGTLLTIARLVSLGGEMMVDLRLQLLRLVRSHHGLRGLVRDERRAGRAAHAPLLLARTTAAAAARGGRLVDDEYIAAASLVPIVVAATPTVVRLMLLLLLRSLAHRLAGTRCTRAAAPTPGE
jgi:hypothetical protein